MHASGVRHVTCKNTFFNCESAFGEKLVKKPQTSNSHVNEMCAKMLKRCCLESASIVIIPLNVRDIFKRGIDK